MVARILEANPMTRRRKIAVAGIAVALILAAGASVTVALRPVSLWERFKQVRDGMTYAEVVAIFGRPGGDSGFIPDIGIKIWQDRRGQAWVHFDENMKACDNRFFLSIEPTSFLDRVLAWLG